MKNTLVLCFSGWLSLMAMAQSVDGTYREDCCPGYFFSQLVLRPDSTFTYETSFELGEGGTSGRWTMKNDTVLLDHFTGLWEMDTLYAFHDPQVHPDSLLIETVDFLTDSVTMDHTFLLNGRCEEAVTTVNGKVMIQKQSIHNICLVNQVEKLSLTENDNHIVVRTSDLYFSLSPQLGEIRRWLYKDGHLYRLTCGGPAQNIWEKVQ